MIADYQEFLASKRLIAPDAGRDIPEARLNPHLFPFQKALARFALRKGRSACWASTGLGKTRICLAWAEHAAERVLLLCPLAVAQQTVREGERIGIPVTYARSQEQAAPHGITATNYELVDRFSADFFDGVALDESSLLKSQDGRTKQKLIEKFRRTPAKLCLTATPAPNDREELANHAEFLGVMTRAEMLACFFRNTDDEGWRLKRHAQAAFYRWLASWAVAMNHPRDLGFAQAGYDLPPLRILPQFIETDAQPADRLFFESLKGVTERASVRRATVADRYAAVLEQMQAEPWEPWLCWYGLLEEGRALKREFGDEAVFVEGSLKPEEKERRLMAFVNGEARVLITHPKLAGFGLNLQHCARMMFVGLDDSFESYFQCIRRCWRFGQQRPVNVHVVLAEPQRVIFENVQAKEREAGILSAELVANAAEFEREEMGMSSDRRDTYAAAREMRLPGWLEAAG